jgi:hypothetical protein
VAYSPSSPCWVPVGTALLSRNTSRADIGQMMGVQQSFGSVARLTGPVCAGAI